MYSTLKCQTGGQGTKMAQQGKKNGTQQLSKWPYSTFTPLPGVSKWLPQGVYASQAEYHSPQLVYIFKGQKPSLFDLLCNYLLWWTVILRAIVFKLGSVHRMGVWLRSRSGPPFRMYAWLISRVSPWLWKARAVSAWFLGLMRSNYALNEVIHVCHFVGIFSSVHLLLNLSLNCKLVLSRLLCLTRFL